MPVERCLATSRCRSIFRLPEMGLGVMKTFARGNLIGGGWGYWGVVRGKTRVLVKILHRRRY